MFRWLADRWSRDAGYRDVLRIAAPLILSTAAWSVQHFVDRMFLTWYSKDAVSASMQGGMACYTIISLFVATAAYCNTFVAQYVGAGRDDRVGTAVWQAVFFGAASAVILLMLLPIGAPLFRMIGHSAAIQKMENTYFQILLAGAAITIVGDAVSSFFSGRGETLTIMWLNFLAVGVNIVLNWFWIFGRWIFPEMGIAGAALATVAAFFIRNVLFFVLMLRKRNRERYGMVSGFRFDPGLFKRLLRFGLPSGIGMTLEILVWTVFVAVIGRYGDNELAATAIAFQINTLAFMPMIGVGMAVSTLVGQRMGEGKPHLAERSTWSAMHLTIIYMACIGTLYWVVPGMFISPFETNADPADFLPVVPMIRHLLRFIAIYTMFDGIFIISSGALKGAGDTRYPVVVALVLSWVVLATPLIVLYSLGYRSIWQAWTCATIYVVLVSVAMLSRFLWGKWKSMKVIEEIPPPHVLPHPSGVPTEVE